MEHISAAINSILARFRKTGPTSIAPPPSVLLSAPKDTYFLPRPRSKKDDTPLRAVYRIYWAIVMNQTIFMRDGIEYFWSQKGDEWMVKNFDKPNDPNPERLAIVAAILHILAAACNRLIELGLPRQAATSILTSEELEELSQKPKIMEEVPQWAVDLPPLDTPLVLPTEGHGAPDSAQDEGADAFMAKKNVLVWKLHIYFT